MNSQVSHKPGCDLGDPIDGVMFIINDLNEWESNSNLWMSAGNNVLVGKHPQKPDFDLWDAIDRLLIYKLRE